MAEEFATKAELTSLAEKNSWLKEWEWRLPAELNALKREFTALKAEFVPINASLPTLWNA